MPVHSREIPWEDNGDSQPPFMWWIQLILISQLQPPPQTPPCPNMKIVASELLICLDLYWLVGSMICKSNNWTESGWYPLEWLNIVHTGSGLTDWCGCCAHGCWNVYYQCIWDCDTYSCLFAAFVCLWQTNYKLLSQFQEVKSGQRFFIWIDLKWILKSMRSHFSRTRRISYCASKFNAGPGEWNFENLHR